MCSTSLYCTFILTLYTRLYAQVINMEENWNSCSLDIIGKVRTCCGVLQRVAACCRTIETVARSILSAKCVRVAVCCSVLQCADFCCRLGTVARSALSARYIRVSLCCCRKIETVACSIVSSSYAQLCAVYGVAAMNRRRKIIGLFLRISSLL